MRYALPVLLSLFFVTLLAPTAHAESAPEATKPAPALFPHIKNVKVNGEDFAMPRVPQKNAEPPKPLKVEQKPEDPNTLIPVEWHRGNGRVEMIPAWQLFHYPNFKPPRSEHREPGEERPHGICGNNPEKERKTDEPVKK